MDGFEIDSDKVLWTKINNVTKDMKEVEELHPVHPKLVYTFKFDPKLDYTELKTIAPTDQLLTFNLKVTNL